MEADLEVPGFVTDKVKRIAVANVDGAITVTIDWVTGETMVISPPIPPEEAPGHRIGE